MIFEKLNIKEDFNVKENFFQDDCILCSRKSDLEMSQIHF